MGYLWESHGIQSIRFLNKKIVGSRSKLHRVSMAMGISVVDANHLRSQSGLDQTPLKTHPEHRTETELSQDPYRDRQAYTSPQDRAQGFYFMCFLVYYSLQLLRVQGCSFTTPWWVCIVSQLLPFSVKAAFFWCHFGVTAMGGLLLSPQKRKPLGAS